MYDRHLDTFLSVADCGSFSKAAEKAWLSPNAIIKQINLLEADLGLTLLVRTNHGVKLTAEGTVIYREAKKLIQLSEQAVREAKEAGQSAQKIIRIGTSLLRPCKTIIALWSAVSGNYPDIQLQIVPFDDNYSEWVSTLQNLGRKIDILAGIYPSTIQEFHCQALKVEDVPLCFAVSHKNPLAARERLSISDLYGETVLIVERGDTSYIDDVRDVLEQNHPQIHLQDVPSYDARTFNLCDASQCAMLTIAAWADVHPSLATIPCEWDYTVPYGIMFSDQPSEIVKTFIGAVKQQTG